MATITVKIQGPGCVHSYKKDASATDWIDAGKTCGQVDMTINTGQNFKFVAEPPFYGQFKKFCDVSNTSCITTPIFEGTVTTDAGTLNAFFDYNMSIIIIIMVVLVIIGYLVYRYFI